MNMPIRYGFVFSPIIVVEIGSSPPTSGWEGGGEEGKGPDCADNAVAELAGVGAIEDTGIHFPADIAFFSLFMCILIMCVEKK